MSAENEIANPFGVLGLTSDATEADVNKAFRKLVVKCHPDTHPDDLAAEVKFKTLTAARDQITRMRTRQAALAARTRRINRIAFGAIAASLTITAGIIAAVYSMSSTVQGTADHLPKAASPAAEIVIPVQPVPEVFQKPTRIDLGAPQPQEKADVVPAMTAAEKAALLARIDADMAKMPEAAAPQKSVVGHPGAFESVQQAGIGGNAADLTQVFKRFFEIYNVTESLPEAAASVPNLTIAGSIPVVNVTDAWIDACIVQPENALLMDPRKHCEGLAEERRLNRQSGRHLRAQ